MGSHYEFFTHQWHGENTVLFGIGHSRSNRLFEEDYRKLREFVAQNYPAWDQPRDDDKIKGKSWYVEYRCDDAAQQIAITVKGIIPSEDFALIQDLTPDGYSLLVKRAP